MTTSRYELFGIEPFPTVKLGDSIPDLICDSGTRLQEGDVVVVASKVISIAGGRLVLLSSVKPSDEAESLSRKTGKDPRITELMLRESVSYRLATDRGPIISVHRLGHELTSAGIDSDTPESAYLLPEDPDASARHLREELVKRSGVDVAVIIADSDGRADRRGSIVLALGSAGIAPLRITIKPGTARKQEETLVDMLAGAAGVILGQRGRGVPVVIVRGVRYERSVEGVGTILHRRSASR